MINEPETLKQDEEKPFHEEGVFDPNLKEKISLRGHRWIQKGPWLECRSCIMHHGAHIGIDRVLTGTDDKGMPILAKRN